MTAQPLHVVIAGAGIGGLCCALALQRRGIRVTVLEQARELGEVGAGFQVSANGSRCLADIGLGEEVKQLATQAEGKQIRLWNTGQTWKLFDLGAESVEKYGFPYYLMYRPDLHALMVRHVRQRQPDAIRLGTKVIGFTQGAEGVNVEVENGETIRGDILIGADGVHSRIRRAMFGESSAQFTGCVAWRGLVPRENLPPHLNANLGTNWVGPGAHVIHYPLREGKLVNFVGIIERSDWQVESWTEKGSVEECLNDFRNWHDDVQRLIKGIDQPYKWALLSRQPMENWTLGRATLLGDACHPTLPFLAQGAVMALEDGVVLARCLAAHRNDPATGLLRYQALRLERTSRIVRGSAANGERFHNSLLADAAEASRYVSAEWNEESVRQRYEWLFSYDATAVDVTNESSTPVES
ncbi:MULTISPECIES: FAD-dependent oxidoreductase [unclassified Pseudomonas]|uniref:FAD-dependent oxidoreductase n=1 Tax=unclassified Pseudomonas TaxID=196821 RepID=UPI0008772871|nr:MULTISPECIES: FAD-dependent oxidoreductase [unclassified Pseudomonas]SCZ47318.1 salicylate hydroxylase [Pseudomonas sp. NFACC44-2]SDA91620.1 salicylate hydroxylase [Pseudomonas sp. NFACC51]SDW45114.1 salicylate hydroxylase [Pseudomonas sp. NFACC08-1]SFJ27086.1 salicylate hydroxylase [Pseudomonas sp. NFACC54]SFT30642.1 salicylate hydroxylase [Pseudomonas sp. NFACC48-1]